MGLLNPVYAVFIPFIFGITIPLAIVAGITSTVAFSVLLCRVIVVYLDLIISIVSRSVVGVSLDKSRRTASISSYGYLRRSPPSSFFSPSPSPSSPPSSYFQLPGPSASGGKQAASPAGSPNYLRRHHRHRRGSIGNHAGGAVTPVGETGLGLIPSVGPERDFEGIGGWRSGGDDDEIWTGINSRLELPDKQHARAGTAGDNGVLMMKSRARSREKRRRLSASPNSSRIRAPSGSRFGYATGQASASAGAAGNTGTTAANRGTKRAPSGM
ncbi:hypothetical protein ESCO_005197 [Escovopsis weberi]|uniref:Uncharacterized protein n=1 Tax=Escovopsis weberi TaxID=150374 RepID=A0A0M9VVV8_ESCWE|nr:hypothetical protein ESCO_005197 [Escovopsis weberi]